MQKSAAALAVLMILIAAPVRAQRGLFLGAHATGASLANQGDNDLLDFGSGFGAHAGLSFGRSFGLLANYDRSIVGGVSGDVDLGQWDLLGRMSWIRFDAANVYLTAGLSKRASTSSLIDAHDGAVLLWGMDPTAGLTGQLMVTSKLAVDAGMLVAVGSFNDNHGHNVSRINRLSVGVSYYVGQ